MASRPFQFRDKKHFKIGKSAAKHFEGLAALSIHSAERRAAVKAGCKPVHFSLDGCLLSCYFSGSVATLRDTLSTSRSEGRGTGAFIYLPPSATPAGITHYTLQAKSCANGGTPLETPDNKTGGMLPSPGAYRRLLSAARFTVCV